MEEIRKNAELALTGFEKQVEEARVSLKKAETQLALAIEKTKQQQKQLKGKDAEKAKDEQAVYDAGMTKTTQSLTAQLRDVARVFCVEVWNEALNSIRVNVDSELRESEKVYYPQPLCIAPSPTSAFPDPSSTSLMPKPALISASATSSDKEEQPQSPIVELRPEEVIEVEQQKKKKKEKAKDVTKQALLVSSIWGNFVG